MYKFLLINSHLPSLHLLFFHCIQKEFPKHRDFEETIDYMINTKIGEGAFGSCHLATELPVENEEEDSRRLFCVKKVKKLS